MVTKEERLPRVSPSSVKGQTTALEKMKRGAVLMGNDNKSDMSCSGYPHAAFIADASLIAGFLLLLQRGFMVRTHVGCSIQDFLHNEMGLTPDTIERIQSIFLDGSPVDDLGSAMIRDGSTLALSAAMPGLVGATMRRGGRYSSFRGSITYRETGVGCAAGEGLVRLKLFNLLLEELGPGFLEKGILVNSADLTDFLKGQSPDFWRRCKGVSLDDTPIDPESLKDPELLSGHGRVFLTVTGPKQDS
jgi:hypothetical protein